MAAANAAKVIFLKAWLAASSEIINSSEVVGVPFAVKPWSVKSVGAAELPVLLPLSVHAAMLASEAFPTEPVCVACAKAAIPQPRKIQALEELSNLSVISVPELIVLAPRALPGVI